MSRNISTLSQVSKCSCSAARRPAGALWRRCGRFYPWKESDSPAAFSPRGRRRPPFSGPRTRPEPRSVTTLTEPPEPRNQRELLPGSGSEPVSCMVLVLNLIRTGLLYGSGSEPVCCLVLIPVMWTEPPEPMTSLL